MSHIVIDSRNIGGSTGRYVERLLHYLQELDTTNRYSVLIYPKDLDKWAPMNTNFTKIACPRKEFSFDEQLGLLKQLKDLKPDLVHFSMVQQPVLYTGTVVTTMHDLTTVRFLDPAKNPVVFKFKQQVYKWVNKRVARKSAHIFTPSAFVRDDVSNFTGVNADKITVTHEGADELPQGAEPVQGLEGAEFIMYVGRPFPHKNLDRFISSFASLKKSHPELKLVLAGKINATYQSFIERVARENIPDVIFTNFISDAQLRWLYENCAAYVFPSLSEGFGLPGLEAMRCGAPVVSSNATCLPEVYGDAAHYFDPLDIEDMSRAINNVLTDKKLRTKLIKAGVARVQEFSWKRMAEQTLEVYKNYL